MPEVDVYGLVNRALKEVIVERGGTDSWTAIAERAGFRGGSFVSNEGYPDELTYDLVAEASDELDVRPDQLLHELGVHWVLHTAQTGYGPLLEASGSDLRAFLVHLPSLHARISLIFPHLRAPEFILVDEGDAHVTLEYHSTRDGLAPFVVGLLDGLGQMYEQPVTVEQLTFREADGFDTFVTRWDAGGP